MKKYSDKYRQKLIREAVCHMDLYAIINLECAIWGSNPRAIEREIGEMSTNQWRACLEMSLNKIILNKE
jgi:hypothetical protein